MARPRKTVIEMRNYELPEEFPILLLEGDRWHISEVPSGRLHFHDCLEIGLCHSHGGTMIFEDEAIGFHADDVTCIPRFLPHTTYSAPGGESLWSYLFLDLGEILRRLLRASTEAYEIPYRSREEFRFVMSRAEHPRVHALVRLIIDEMHDQGSNYQSAVEGLCLALYLELLRVQEASRRCADVPSVDRRKETLSIRPALDHIRANYAGAIAIDGLAELCHLSPTHFRRAFHEIMRQSPLHYINELRIQQACALLRTTEMSILAISEGVGFRSVSSFNRHFRACMGMTPSQYRQDAVWPDRHRERITILEYSGWL